MKKIFTILAAAVMAVSLPSCDAIFDNLEGDLTKMTGDDLTSSEDGIDRLFSYVYTNLPMGAFNSGDKSTSDAVDNHGGSTLSPSGVVSFWNYTYMRDVNNLIKQIETANEKGVISDELKDQYLGEAYFIRAYYYFGMVRTLGGVPIVTEPLDDKYDGGENAGLYVARSTEKETWDFVLSELDKAAELLPESHPRGAYRANKWAALGLKSRVALYAASVSRYWNNASIASSYTAVAQKLTYMEESYAANYYQQCIAASEQIIKSGEFSLYGANPSSVSEAVDNLTELFQARQDCEWIFGKSYQNGVSTNTNGFDVPNSPNQIHGTNSSYWSFGNYAVTSDFVDACDDYDENYGAVDGTIKTRVDGVENSYIGMIHQASGIGLAKNVNYIEYNSVSEPFLNKDARFQAYVIYPGCTFRNTNIVIQGGLWHPNGTLSIYDLSDKETVNGTTYYGLGAANAAGCSGFYARGNTNDGSHYCTGFGIRKYLDPTSTPAYSQNPWYDIRYAEILLNYCEAEVELNGTNAGDSQKYLNQIRRRAYFLDTEDATLTNVIHERRIELAFEDDYAMTMYRRRAYFNSSRDGVANENLNGRRHALIPVCDLRSGSPKYVFVRAYFYKEDTDVTAKDTDPKSYYTSISNYTSNGIVPNPSQE